MTSDRPTALIVDYGGVLTTSLTESTQAWCEGDGLDLAEFGSVVLGWLEEAATDPTADNPIHSLEIGAITVPEFERSLAARLRTTTGEPPPADGLLSRMFAGLTLEPRMADVLRRLRAQGIATGLLSNSWGLDYPRDGWDELFDTVVISGEVGLRKPDGAIFRLAAERIGRDPSDCVFVDDLPGNVRGAVATGMVGIAHVDPVTTIAELEAVFGLSLSGE